MAAEFLAGQNFDRSVDFGGSFGLFLPVAMVTVSRDTADKVGSQRLRQTTRGAALVHHVEVALRRVRLDLEFWFRRH
jgi:hypothetical protein